jgi:hypothetical protein
MKQALPFKATSPIFRWRRKESNFYVVPSGIRQFDLGLRILDWFSRRNFGFHFMSNIQREPFDFKNRLLKSVSKSKIRNLKSEIEMATRFLLKRSLPLPFWPRVVTRQHGRIRTDKSRVLSHVVPTAFAIGILDFRFRVLNRRRL